MRLQVAELQRTIKKVLHIEWLFFFFTVCTEESSVYIEDILLR